MTPQQISSLIDNSPMNRGISGVEWIADPENFVCVSDGGSVVMFQYEAPGVYQFHWIDTQARGRKAIDDAKAAIEYALTDKGAHLLYGLVSTARRDVLLMARWIGSTFVRNVQTPHGECALFTKTR